jgi:hypothetical protein
VHVIRSLPINRLTTSKINGDLFIIGCMHATVLRCDCFRLC